MNKFLLHIIRAPILGGTEKLSSYVSECSLKFSITNVIICVNGKPSSQFESIFPDNCRFIYLNTRLKDLCLRKNTLSLAISKFMLVAMNCF